MDRRNWHLNRVSVDNYCQWAQIVSDVETVEQMAHMRAGSVIVPGRRVSRLLFSLFQLDIGPVVASIFSGEDCSWLLSTLQIEGIL